MSINTKQDSLVFEDEIWSQGFTQVPNIILTNNKISPPARLLYILLLKHAWGSKDMVYPGQERLAGELGCTKRHIRNLLVELKNNNLLSWKRRAFNKTNIYTLKKVATTRLDRNHSSSQIGSTVPSKKTKNNKIKRESPSKEKVSSEEVVDDCQDAVLGFLDLGYPEDFLDASLRRFSKDCEARNKRFASFGARFENWVIEDKEKRDKERGLV